MDLVGSFPFGWVRNYKEDNWQLIWDSKSKVLFIKSATTDRIVEYCKCESWEDAKSISDEIRSNPELIENIV